MKAAGLRKHAEERQRMLDIEAFLKDKFREGCIRMKQLFEAEDRDKTGSVGL